MEIQQLNNAIIIFHRELKSFFDSPMAYVFLVVFAVVNGYFFTNTFFLYGQSDMRALFGIVPLVYLFFIPGVMMGLISREKGLGTLEIISTLPIHDRDIVLGKYLAGFVLILIALLTTSLHYITLIAVGNVSFIVGIAIIFVFWLMDKMLLFVHPSLAGIVQYLSVEFHLSNISRGVIDTRNIIYFGSVIGFFLFLTTRLVESRRWS